MQKIVPCLWFDTQAEEAVNFYTDIFPTIGGDSKILESMRYDADSAKVSGQQEGAVMTVSFRLSGYNFLALNGGPQFKFNPSISFILNFDPSKNENAQKEFDTLWEKLSQGGTALMPLDAYDFSKHYGWIQDKYGLSWQLMLTNPAGEPRPFITPSLLFVKNNAGKAEEAIEFYLSVFSGSKSGSLNRYPAGMEPDKEGSVMFADFQLLGTWIAAMDSAREHKFNFNEAISLMVNCENQEEIDLYWEKLSAVPESEQCGWLKDKYGVSWQIIPGNMNELLAKNPAKTTPAMLNMKKIIIEDLKRAGEEN
jgi:predicted 3-demethylubiquinone-9 3-methyltransferase (glyoxalase superfamily)